MLESSPVISSTKLHRWQCQQTLLDAFKVDADRGLIIFCKDVRLPPKIAEHTYIS